MKPLALLLSLLFTLSAQAARHRRSHSFAPPRAAPAPEATESSETPETTPSAQPQYWVAWPHGMMGTRVQAIPGHGSSSEAAIRECRLVNVFGNTCSASLVQ